MFSGLFGRSKRKNSKVTREGDWVPLIQAIEQRMDQLDEDESSLVSFGNGDYKQIVNHPTLEVWRLPVADLPEALDFSQITFTAPDPTGIGPEDIFLAWAVAEFQVLERKGKSSYARGNLLRDQTKDALVAAFAVIEATYLISKHEELIVLGDEEFQAILANTDRIREVSRFRFLLGS